jgi:menaquinone-dependent protoporphyrinogen oxidase
MARILVVYGTAYGQTQRIARRIVDRLADYGHELSMYQGDHLPANLSLDDYDAFLVAASIIRGRHQRYIRDFVRNHVLRLTATPSAFVSVSGAAAGSAEEARRYMEVFFEETGWRPAFPVSFAGSMAYTQYGFVLRWIIKLISRRRGGPTDTTRDHEMTDWEAVDRFADQLAQALPSPRDADQAETLLLATGR